MAAKQLTKSELRAMTKAQLIQLAQSAGIPTKGLLKQQLIDAILNLHTLGESTDKVADQEFFDSTQQESDTEPELGHSPVKPSMELPQFFADPNAVTQPSASSFADEWKYRLEMQKLVGEQQAIREQRAADQQRKAA